MCVCVCARACVRVRACVYTYIFVCVCVYLAATEAVKAPKRAQVEAGAERARRNEEVFGTSIQCEVPLGPRVVGITEHGDRRQSDPNGSIRKI